MNIRKSIILRVRIAFLIICLVAVAVLARIVHLQYIDGDKWNAMADNIGLKYKKVKATRGNIYSDNGSLLATSLPLYRVAFDPTVAEESMFNNKIDSLAIMLAHFFKDKNTTYYKRRIKDARIANKQYLILNRKLINYQQKKGFVRMADLQERSK